MSTLGVEIGTVDLLPILGRPAERLGGRVQLVADGLGQLVGKDPEVRRLADEPLILRQFDVADLAGLPVLLLSRRPKHLAADQSFTGIEFADHAVRPRLSAADLVLIEESGDIDRAFSIAGDEFRTAHDPCCRLRVHLGPLLDRALMGDHRAAIRIPLDWDAHLPSLTSACRARCREDFGALPPATKTLTGISWAIRVHGFWEGLDVGLFVPHVTRTRGLQDDPPTPPFRSTLPPLP
jgi:hypothetical protein